MRNGNYVRHRVTCMEEKYECVWKQNISGCYDSLMFGEEKGKRKNGDGYDI